MSDNLIQFNAGTIGEDYLRDFLSIVALDIENSLLSAGAEPGKDYSIKDLYSWAMPFALHEAKCGKLKWMYQEHEGSFTPAIDESEESVAY